MSYSVYKIVHILGILTLFSALGAIALHRMQGGDSKFALKRWSYLLHGIGLFLALLGGFGLLTRLGIHGQWPLWVWGKLAIWLALGAASVLILKRPSSLARWTWLGTLLLGAVATYLANYKPL